MDNLDRLTIEWFWLYSWKCIVTLPDGIVSQVVSDEDYVRMWGEFWDSIVERSDL